MIFDQSYNFLNYEEVTEKYHFSYECIFLKSVMYYATNHDLCKWRAFMKISKVNHIKTAVSTTGGIQKGILYIDPAREGKSIQNVRDHVSRRNEDAKRLYSVFNKPGELTKKDENDESSKAEEEKLNIIRSIVREGNEIFHLLINTGNIDIKALKHSVRITEEHSERDYDIPDSILISETVKLYVRKGLSDRASLNAIEQIMLYHYKYFKWDDMDMTAVQSFLDTLYKDYNKITQKPLYERSIANQNMVTQPETMNDTAVIQLSGKKKKEEKEGLNSFLFDYALIDEDARKEYRIKLRRLLILYFYGRDQVPADSFDEWKDHAARRQFDRDFVNVNPIDKDNKDKNYEKLYFKELGDLIRTENIRRYRDCISAVKGDDTGLYFEDFSVNKFWIHHMENAVERILAHLRKDTLFKLNLGYLSEKVWKDIINQLSIKYIAIGKSVYHFAMDELNNLSDGINLLTIPDHYVNGISSFEYEMIKASESLQRDIAVYVLFSGIHLANNTVILESEGEEDFLGVIKNEDIILPNERKNILQFFGGASVWKDFDFDKWYTEYKPDYSDRAFLSDLRKMLYSMRNESFHFRTENRSIGGWNQPLISAMFSFESSRAVQIMKDKFYSNNLVLFYKNKDLRTILDKLYSDISLRSSQVPAFQNVFVRKNFHEDLKDLVPVQASFDQENIKKWQSGLYYLLKEVYYCLFLQDKSVKYLFIDTVRNLHGENEMAVKNFIFRVNKLVNLSMPEICQTIMTDQNMQNSSNRKAKSTFASKRNPDIFKHYKILLYQSLRETFVKYISKVPELAFIKNPEMREIPLKAEDFLPDWNSPIYEKLAKELSDSPDLQRWYILGKFLEPKQLNHLTGALRNYIQYTKDIKRRSRETQNSLHINNEEKINMLVRYIEVLEICQKISGTVSTDPLDYFDNTDAYAEYLQKYLDYDNIHVEKALSASIRLRTFCSESIESDPSQKIGLFYDEGNLILNRNLVLSKLYGASKLLPYIIKRVTKADIDGYYQSKEKIKNIDIEGCRNEDEQKDLKRYQELKNKIEFRNIVEYSELIDELFGQLVNWTYLRERDLMFFQLGFHYMALHNKEKKPDSYRHISTLDGKDIEGAILYQIAASYVNGLPVYVPDKAKQTFTPGKYTYGLTSLKLRKDFAAYTLSEQADGNVDLYYMSGLELFENVSEHTDIIKLRNDIDHFKFYSHQERSLLELYSEIFDRFFTYDMKYQKNVVNLLENILLQHMVILRPSFGTGTKPVNGTDKACAAIQLGSKSLYSDDFTYKYDKGSRSITIPAKNKDFLHDVAAILCYPHKPEENIVNVRIAGQEKKIEEKKDRKNGRTALNNKRHYDKRGRYNNKGNSNTYKNDSQDLKDH